MRARVCVCVCVSVTCVCARLCVPARARARIIVTTQIAARLFGRGVGGGGYSLHSYGDRDVTGRAVSLHCSDQVQQ